MTQELTIQRIDKTKKVIAEYVIGESTGFRIVDFQIDSPTPRHTREEIEGMDGFIDQGTTYEGRTLSATLIFLAYDRMDYSLKRNEIFRIFDSREQFYLIDSLEPGKRWLVRSEGYSPEQLNPEIGKFEIKFTSPYAYAESVGTTLDPKTFEYGPSRKLGPTLQFSRNSTAYLSDGTRVEAGRPRYEPGKYGQALMIEEGTTNLFQSPKMDTTIGWVASNGGTLTVVDAPAPSPYGNTKCIRGTGTSPNQFMYITQTLNLSLNTEYAVSFVVYVPNSIPPGKAKLAAYYDDGKWNLITNIAVEERDRWVKKSLTFTSDATVAKHVLGFGIGDVTDAGGLSCYAAFGQLEQKPYATSFVDGTRANEVVTLPTDGVLSADEGTIDIWVWVDDTTKRQIDSSYNRIFYMVCSGNAGITAFHHPSEPSWRFEVRTESGVYLNLPIEDALTPNGWNLFTFIWDKKNNTIRAYVNGQFAGSRNDVAIPSEIKVFYLGSTATTNWLNTKFDSVRFSSIARTDEEIAAYDLSQSLPMDEYTTAKYDFEGTLHSGSNLWQIGQGLTLDETHYTHTTGSFVIYNAGDVTIDPRRYPLVITYKGQSNNLKIENKRTGDVWQYNGTTTATDTVELNGVRSLKNGVSIFKQTNRRLITLQPGANEFQVTGPNNEFEITFDFRFYTL